MALWSCTGLRGGDVGTWTNVYLPDGTPVRNAKDAVIPGPGERTRGERPVRLVIGERDELVIDMSESMARSLATVLNAVTGVRAEGAGGAMP